jgi:hypothetical protein
MIIHLNTKEKMARKKDEHHSPEELRAYMNRNYTDMGNMRHMSIGFMGGRYRIVMQDTQKVLHTFRIDPKDVDADIAKVSKEETLGRARKLAGAVRDRKPNRPDKDHDRER